MIIQTILNTSLGHFSFKGRENVLFKLKLSPAYTCVSQLVLKVRAKLLQCSHQVPTRGRARQALYAISRRKSDKCKGTSAWEEYGVTHQEGASVKGLQLGKSMA